MNGYLVELIHTMDDLPIGLFATRGEADEFASKVRPMPTAAMRRVFNTDCSTPVGVSITRFRLGKPDSRKMVRQFEG